MLHLTPGCPQAYGAKQYKVLGEVLQRALLVCWAACIPVALLWTHSESLMLSVGQSAEVAAMAGRYLQLCIPCIFLNIGTDVSGVQSLGEAGL